MHVTHPLIQEYCEAHSTPEPPYLLKLNRDTHAKVLNPRMLSGHLQGRALAAFSRMINPSRILEIGTYTGYSTLCLAEGLKSGGSLVTLERNDELEPFHKAYFLANPSEINIKTHYGDALISLSELNGYFDLVFIDADKSEWSIYFQLEHGL
jgi:caffeoyl-CoA O-methyltransferase